MNNFKNILKQFGDTYFIEDVINKNKVIQDLDGYNTLLIEAFIKDETIKKNFTINVSGNTVIQINKLIELFEMDEYWKDSYTKYSKKIGLTTNTKFIDETTDIVLDFPYKDTILKASMSKENTDKDELRPNEPQYLKNLVNSLDEMNLPTGEDKKIHFLM
ncbi:site-specific DNA-methyltransferase [Staphylococcus epidermidis]|uniref:site-specific DNA-methyltransferase n=1 Tax=Staphylococcus epidermidis TaxID=1282 RepID=UPI0030C2FBC7